MGVSELASMRGYSSGEMALIATHHVGMAVADYWTGGLAELGPLLGNWIGGDFGRFLALGPGAFIKPSIPRRVREVQNVRDVLMPNTNALIATINAAKTPEELFNTLVAWGSGYTGGTSRVAFSMTVLGKTIGNVGHGTEGPYGPYATVDDLLNNPETIRVGAQLGVSQHFLDDVNRAVEAAIKAKVAELNAVLGQGLVGYIEPVYGGAATRSTVEQLSSALGRGRAFDLSVQSRSDLKAFFNDDNLVEAFLRRAAAVDRDRDLGILNTEQFIV